MLLLKLDLRRSDMEPLHLSSTKLLSSFTHTERTPKYRAVIFKELLILHFLIYYLQFTIKVLWNVELCYGANTFLQSMNDTAQKQSRIKLLYYYFFELY